MSRTADALRVYHQHRVSLIKVYEVPNIFPGFTMLSGGAVYHCIPREKDFWCFFSEVLLTF